MKAIILIITLSAITGTAGMAQSAYSKGDNLLSLGVGIGNNYFGFGYKSSLPVNPTITYEHGFSDDITTGATVSYATSKYNYGDESFNYSAKLTSTYIGVRASYHFNEILNLNNSKLDAYGGAGLGYVVVSYSSKIDGASYSGGSIGSGIGYAFYIGGRYFFSKKAGIYAELGYASLSVLNAGINFKF